MASVRCAGAILLICVAARAQTVRAGPLAIEIHISRTAQIYHIVDQLSAWNEFSHPQYRKHFPLDARDKRILLEHATLRGKYGWGRGLERVMYSTAGISAALNAGVSAKHITRKEAARERRVLKHFEKRIDLLLKEERPRLDSFAQRIVAQRAKLTEIAQKLSRFCHGVEVAVPVYLIANPSDNYFGGGYNGGFLTLEIARKSDLYATFLHELMHAFLDPHKPLLKRTAHDARGLDTQTLDEGIAYAISPGIYHAGTSLADRVKRDISEGRGFADDALVRFRRYGHALTPLMKDALQDGRATLKSFLPKAAEAWDKLVKVESERVLPARARTYFSAGPGWKLLDRLLGRKANYRSFNHGIHHYRKILLTSRPGEPIFLLYALDHDDRAIVKGYEDFLPKPWAAIEAMLRQGKTVELKHDARKRTFIVLAAPTVKKLEKLIAKSKYVDKPVK